MQAERMIKKYWSFKQELSVLEFEIEHCANVNLDDVITSLSFSYASGERVQTSGVSDKTAKTAIAYRGIVEQMDEEWYGHLLERYKWVVEELAFFEYGVERLSGRLPAVVRDMVIEQLTWRELADKYNVSEAMIGKYRVVQQIRSSCFMQFILS